MGTNKEPPMPFGRPIAAACSDMMSLLGPAAIVLCCQCGRATSAGTSDWVGRYRCDDCAHKDAVNAMAQRLAAVEAEDRERAAMWGLDA